MSMKRRKVNIDRIRSNVFLILFFVFVFCAFVARIFYLCYVDYNVGSETISSFIKNRNTEEEVIMPVRGSIFDKNGEILAEDVASYSIIAYLDESRSKDSDVPLHVVDVDITAEKLAPLLDTDVGFIKGMLSKNLYQVELGSGGRNLSQIQMEEIKALNLPGIDFVASTKRYYPNGNFASYAVGFTLNEEDSDGNTWKVGKLGIEEYYNDNLTGRSGYITYEKDRNGYKIANGREYVEEAINGDDIYLTIDNNIQLFTENATKKMMDDSQAEWGVVVVADAKTGAILSYTSAPSFDPNHRDITNYIDLLTGNSYEPGSTMKIFSYLCSIDNGLYNGEATYQSGSIAYPIGDNSNIVIHDWREEGWGVISYDHGFAMSSNVGAAGLLRNGMLDKQMLKECYAKYGFGQTTGFTLDDEVSGSVKFNYDVDVASASFGQAITVTPIQMVQALTMISNDGKMLKPYIVDKIVNSNTKEVNYESSLEVVDVVADVNSINKIKSLMDSVVCPDSANCTGSAYYMEDYKLIGKTGTAQIYDESTGTYMIGDSNYIYSFAGLYPGNDPSVIIYAALKRPKDATNYVAQAVKDIIVNTSKYLNITVDNKEVSTYDMGEYVNKSTSVVRNELESNGIRVFVLGNGDKVIRQYPSSDVTLYNGSVACILTNNYDKVMPNLVGLSYKDASNILKLMGVSYKLEGNGYVTSQNIIEGSAIGDGIEVVLSLSR